MANTLTKSFPEPKKIVEKSTQKNKIKGAQKNPFYHEVGPPRLPNVNAVIRKKP